MLSRGTRVGRQCDTVQLFVQQVPIGDVGVCAELWLDGVRAGVHPGRLNPFACDASQGFVLGCKDADRGTATMSPRIRNGKLVGYFGWLHTTEAIARKWLTVKASCERVGSERQMQWH